MRLIKITAEIFDENGKIVRGVTDSQQVEDDVARAILSKVSAATYQWFPKYNRADDPSAEISEKG